MSDLREPQAWLYPRAFNALHGLPATSLGDDRNVIMSRCGRYTVVRYPDGVILPFRRRGQPEFRRWNPPEPLRRCADIAAAVDFCAAHAATETPECVTP
jgi:hypothetical protein